MRFFFISSTVLFSLLLFLTVLQPYAALAAVMDQGQRLSLAQEFVQRLKGVYRAPASADIQTNALSSVPVGQTLLLRPAVGQAFYDVDIFAVNQQKGIYLSFTDMMAVLGLAVDLAEDNATADGWFLREDWLFEMDLVSGAVVSRGQTMPVQPDEYVVKDGDLFVLGRTLGEWFGMEFGYNIADQLVEIGSEYPLPGIARLERLKRKGHRFAGNSRPVLPRIEKDYAMFDLNTADVNIQSNYRRLSGPVPDTSRSQRATVTLQGQALKHNLYTLGTYNKRDNDTNNGLQTVVARLSKREEDPVLLGPLKARSYTIGDTSSTDVPLTGSNSQDLGIRITNNPLERINFTTTDIRGDSTPGWDVELYRNGTLVDLQVVAENGRYNFEDVQLFINDNDFELLFYGPQGEIREETVSVPVNRALLSSQNHIYDVSLSLTDKQTFRQIDSGDEDTNTLHAAGRYNFFVGDAFGFAGFRNRQVDGENKLYLAGGLTNIWNGYFIDTNIGVDDAAEIGTELGVRKSFGTLDWSATAELRTDEFTPEGGTNPSVFSFNTVANSPVPDWIGKNSRINTGYRYDEFANGDFLQNTRMAYSTRIGPFQVNNALRNERSELGGVKREELQNSTNLRGGYRKLSWRAGMTYDFKPIKEVDEYRFQLGYRQSNKLSGEVNFRHDPATRFSETRLSGNWTHDKFRLSPFVEMDNQDELFAGVNVSFGLIDTPDDNIPAMTSRSLNNRGIVTAFVFLDENGNMVFDEGDQPLEDVIVESVNYKRRVPTDEDGKAMIVDMPAYIATDIHVDTESFPEPFMLPAFEGMSVMARPGELYDLSFPIHYAGEMDGTIRVLERGGHKKQGSFVHVQLLPLETERNKVLYSRGAEDGFYVFSLIAPGRYYLVPRADDVRKFGAAQPIPRLVEVGYDGTVLYGHDIELAVAHKNVPFVVLDEEMAASMALRPVADRSQATPEYFINIVQDDSSRLLKLFHNLRLKKYAEVFLVGLQKFEVVESETQKIVTRYRVPDHDIEEAFWRCSQMVKHDLPCQVEAVLPPSIGAVSDELAMIDADI